MGANGSATASESQNHACSIAIIMLCNTNKVAHFRLFGAFFLPIGSPDKWNTGDEAD
jgi:hypothetical protein